MRHAYFPHSSPGSTRQRLLLVLTVLVLAVVALPLTATAAADPSITLAGGGFGHSVGMSQFGAYGMARSGYSWQEIMEHYFTGSSPAEVDPELASKPIWVNLTTEKATLGLTVTSIGTPAAAATLTSTAGQITAQPGETLTVTRRADGTCRTTTPAGTLDGPCTIDLEWNGWDDSPTSALVLDGCSLVNWNLASGGRLQPCTYARGGMRIRPDNNTNTVNLSLEIDMEDYVLGVSEMPNFWGTTGGQAALEAQAVAARSYAYAKVIQRGDPANRPWCWCQVFDTTVDQNYVGWGHGTQEWGNAVAATTGQVMTHPSRTVAGKLVPIETFYSSSTFGWTEDSENGFTAYVPYLRSVDDHWAILPEVGNSNATWTRTMTGSALAAALPGMGTVTDARVTKCSTTGAALEIVFSGSGGPRTYKTRDLRGLLSLRSMQVLSVTSPTGTTSCADSSGGSPTTTTTVAQTTTTTTAPQTTTTTTTLPVTTGDACTAIAPDNLPKLLSSNAILRIGSRGQAVRELELFLLAMGYSPMTPDRTFGSRTAGAVKAFQDDRGLTVDGMVGSRTRGEIALIATAAAHIGILDATNELLAAGARGSDVRDLQHLLASLGFDPGPKDGVYGAQTTNAVRAFQQAKKLLVDGLFGARSWNALARQFGLDPTVCR